MDKFEEARTLYRLGVSQRSIWERLGISREKIAKACRGIVPPPKKKELSPDTRAEALRLLSAGYTNREVMKKIPVTVNQLTELRKQEKIPRSHRAVPQAVLASKAWREKQQQEAQERLRHPIREYYDNGLLVKVYPTAYAEGAAMGVVENKLF